MSNKELIKKILEDITMRINNQSIDSKKRTKEELDIFDHKKNEFIKKKDIGPKKVITERDILNLVGSIGELVISKGTIITPLAKDTARENKIKIIFNPD